MKKILVLLLLTQIGYAQNSSYQWFDPATSTVPVIDGRGWHKELSAPYDRFPARAEKDLRPALWNLSRHSAGEYIQFETNSKTIIVRYAVNGAQSLPHMPATGVSGLDLYAKDANEDWRWAKGTWKFGDTIEYRFDNMRLSRQMEQFRLYLPLYTSVQWMQIGVPEGKILSANPVSEDKPIVTYGTSIMHGACSSRPGLAWTNILGRKLNCRIINLGFSGNGQLEKPVIDLITELDARVFLLDCMPNLSDRSLFPAEEIEKRMRTAVNEIQRKHPGIPIVFAEHCSAVEGMNMDTAMTERYQAVSVLAATIFNKMKSDGIKNIYHLSAREIGFDTESTVDGTHPNDIGMMKYAEAYHRILAPLLKSN